jgi:hypothetical protein
MYWTDEMTKMFGYTPPPALSGTAQSRASEVYDALVEMREKYVMHDVQIFRAAGVTGPLCGYLNALHTTPQCVLDYCEAVKADAELGAKLRAA